MPTNWRQYEYDLGFKSLDYSNQQFVKAEMAKRHFFDDPEFASLPRNVQQVVLEQYIQKPVFLNDDLNLNTPTNDLTTSTLRSIVENASLLDDPNNSEARLKATLHSGTLGLLDATTVKLGAKGIEILQELFTGQDHDATIDRINAGQAANTLFQQLYGSDTEKMQDYLSSQVAKNDVKSAQIVGLLSSLGVQIGEGILLNKFLVGSAATVAKAAAGQGAIKGGLFTQKAFEGLAKTYSYGKNIKPFAQFMGLKVAPVLLEETAEGVAWGLRGLLDDALSGESTPVQEVLGNFAADFGFGMGLQAVFAGAGLVKNGWNLSKRRLNLPEIDQMIDPADTKRALLGLLDSDLAESVVKENLIRGGTKEAEEYLNYARKQRSLHNPDLDITDPDELVRQTMAFHGIELTKKTDGTYDLTSFGPVKFSETAEDLPTAVKQFEIFENKLTGKVSVIEPKDFVTDDLQFKRQSTMTPTTKQSLPMSTYLNSLNPPDGQLNTVAVENSVKSFLRSENVSQDILEAIKVRQAMDYFSGQRFSVLENDTLTIPTEISSLREQELFAGHLKAFLRSKSGNDAKVLTQVDSFVDIMQTPRGRRLYEDQAWIDRQLQTGKYTVQQRDGKYFLTGADIQPRTFDNKKDLGEYLYLNTIDEASVKNYLEQEFGYSLKQDKTGQWIVQRGGQGTLGPFADVRGLLSSYPNFRPPYPIDTAPLVSIIDPAASKVRTLSDKIISGPLSLVQEHLRHHQSYKSTTSRRQIKGLKTDQGKRIFFNPESQTYTLRSKTTGIERQFGSFKKLNEFLDQTSDTLSDLEQQAAKINGRLTVDHTGYWLSTEAGQRFFTRVEQLENYLSSKSANIDVPELVPDVDEAFLKTLQQKFKTDLDMPLESGAETVTEALSKNRPLLNFSESFKDFTARFRANIGVLEGLTEKYPEAARGLNDVKLLRTSVQNHELHMNRLRTALSRQIKTSKLSRVQRKNMTNILMQELPESQWSTYAREHDLQLTPGMAGNMRLIRQIFDQVQDNFNIPQHERIENYFTRLKAVFHDEIVAGGLPEQASLIIRRATASGKLPSMAEEYFRHARTSDVLSFVLEEDPFTILMKYLDIGYRKKNVGPFFDRIRQTVEEFNTSVKGKKGQVMPERYGNVLTHILNSSTGATSSQALRGLKKATLKGTIALSKGLKTAEDAILKLFPARAAEEKVSALTRLRDNLTGFSQRVVTDDPFSLPSNLVIGATQAFKPWLVIRNTFQPWMTVSPFFGYDYTMAGYNSVAKDFKRIHSYMFNRGMLNSVAPTEIARGNRNSVLNKLNEKGMRAYKLSDDITRMVAFATVDHKFTDALTALRNNPALDQKWFVKNSGLFSVDPTTQEAVFKALEAGQVQVARDTFARDAISNGLFDYMSIAKPEAHSGTIIGKIFSMFGTYPTQFTENILRAVRTGDLDDKLLFAVRLMGASTALTYMTQQITGSDYVQDFNPVASMTFSGGPMFDLSTDALAITGDLGRYVQTGELGYSGNQAVGRIGNTLKSTFIPYQGAMWDLFKGADSLLSGDLVNASRSLLRAPGRQR